MGFSNVRRVFFGAVIGATGLALAAPFSQPGAAAASNTSAFASGTTGIVAPSHAAAAAAGQTATHAQRGVRATARSTAVASSRASAATAAQASASVPSSLLQNFNGTSSNDSRRTNFNQEFEPPDQGLCVGIR